MGYYYSMTILMMIMISFLAFIFFSEKKIKKIYLLALGVSPVLMIYGLKPAVRIISHHGLLHAGIVYNMLNGHVPPLNPFLAGERLQYGWGYHFLASRITQMLDVTPFYSFAIINIAALCLSTVLIYKISRLLIRDARANILSVVVALFAALSNLNILRGLYYSLGIFPEMRGQPFYNKFINVNAFPSGTAFFLLFLYSIIKIVQGRRTFIHPILLIGSSVGCGFFYPGILPVLVLCSLSVVFSRFLTARGERASMVIKEGVFIVSPVLFGILLLKPYLSGVGAGLGHQLRLLEPFYLYRNGLKYLLVNIPMLAVLYMNRGFLKRNLDRRAAAVLSITVFASFILYLLVHVPRSNEYKFLTLSTTMLGILGGIAFGAMRKNRNKLLPFAALCVFLLHFPEVIYKVPVTWRFDIDSIVERGKNVYFRDKEKDELCRWIAEDTPADSVFIDTAKEIPVFGRRQLFFSLSDKRDAHAKGEEERDWRKGYFYSGFLSGVCSYPQELLCVRWSILYDIYAQDRRELNERTVEFLSNSGGVYIVARNEMIREKMKRVGFEEIFSTSRGRFRIYRWKGQSA